MERPLKERTIGAIVLVVFAVLIVPVFLDGPADEAEMITESVTLPGQNDQPRQQQTIVLERDRDQPVPAALPAADGADGDDSAAEEAPAPEAEAPAPVPAPAVEPAASAGSETQAPAGDEEPTAAASPEAPTSGSGGSSETGLWAVQLGSFSNRDNAERLAADLRGEGYAAFLSKLDTASGQLHRVRVGPQDSRDAAEGVAATLAGAGHKGQVVPHP